MAVVLQHEMRPELNPDEVARGRFASGFRSFILNDLAADLRQAYEDRVAPDFARVAGRPPKDGGEVHRAIRPDPAFKVYSACRVNAQQMVWESVGTAVRREAPRLEAIAARTGATARLDPAFVPPRNVTAIDVHLMPGGYTGSEDASPIVQGALYDQGVAIFSMGLFGKNLDDIGLSIASYIKARFPDFRPKAILDLGCTIGHNTLPWKQTYPEAEVSAVDVVGPLLTYGAARASLQGQEVEFAQMSADDLDFPDQSFDIVFSSMFLHELSTKVIRKVLVEARRVLRPGGLMVHMELPPNAEMGAFEGFFLDWDSWYNKEPFYKAFRDLVPRAECVKAGFAEEDYFQFVVPSIGIYGSESVSEAAGSTLEINRETTGRLAEGVHWFGFGAWKA